jgi:hypothetical protein
MKPQIRQGKNTATAHLHSFPSLSKSADFNNELMYFTLSSEGFEFPANAANTAVLEASGSPATAAAAFSGSL